MDFVAIHGLTFPILRDNQPGATARHYGVRYWSEFRVLRKQGDRVTFRLVDREGNPVAFIPFFDAGLIERLLTAVEGSDP